MIYCLVLIAILFIYFVCAMMREKSTNSEVLIDKDTSVFFKGFLTTYLIIYHIFQKLFDGTQPILYEGLIHFSNVCFSIFFLFFGYEITKTYLEKDNNQFLKYLGNRTIKTTLLLLFVILMYCAFSFSNGQLIGLSEVLANLSKGKVLLPYSWYVINIILFYFLFYISIKLAKDNKQMLLLIMAVFTLAISYLYIIREFDYYWYMTLPSVLFGIVSALYEEKIISLYIDNKKTSYTIICLALILLFFIIHRNTEGITELFFCWMMFIQYDVFFFILTIGKKIKNNILSIIGSISLEIYLVQGIIFNVFRSNLIFVNNDFLYIVLCLLSTILSSYLLHRASNNIFGK